MSSLAKWLRSIESICSWGGWEGGKCKVWGTWSCQKNITFSSLWLWLLELRRDTKTERGRSAKNLNLNLWGSWLWVWSGSWWMVMPCPMVSHYYSFLENRETFKIKAKINQRRRSCHFGDPANKYHWYSFRSKIENANKTLVSSVCQSSKCQRPRRSNMRMRWNRYHR